MSSVPDTEKVLASKADEFRDEDGKLTLIISQREMSVFVTTRRICPVSLIAHSQMTRVC
jgi:hypothetical protein